MRHLLEHSADSSCRSTPKAFPTTSTSTSWRLSCTTGKTNGRCPIGGSQDAWGSVYPGINLLHYDFRHHNGVLPKTVSSIVDQRTASWFERSFWIVDCVGPRPEGYNPFDGGRFATRRVVEQLGKSGQDCFAAIKTRDVERLGASFNLCSSAWRKMLPAIFEHPNDQGARDGKAALLPAQVRGRHALGLWRRLYLCGLFGTR